MKGLVPSVLPGRLRCVRALLTGCVWRLRWVPRFNADKRPGERPHLAMHRRPTESTYEERTSRLDAKKALKDTAAAEGVSGSSEV